MPIYEYKCEDCGKVTEILVKNTSSQGPVECSACKSKNTNRLISAPGAVRVKGGGDSHADIPASCPNQGSCGMPYGSCPASKMPHHHH
jgi:putative FmdB family regulatory protein